MEQYLTEDEIIEFSKQHPAEVFTSDEGKIVFQGFVFENKKELDDFILLAKVHKKPVGKFIFKALVFANNIFRKKKK